MGTIDFLTATAAITTPAPLTLDAVRPAAEAAGGTLGRILAEIDRANEWTARGAEHVARADAERTARQPPEVLQAAYLLGINGVGNRVPLPLRTR